MNLFHKILILITLLFSLPINYIHSNEMNEEQYSELFVVFAGASENFITLDSTAKKISDKTSIKYENTLVYDQELGMIEPKSATDDIYAGSYYPRRFAGEGISIEMAYYYNEDPKISKKLMTIVSGIFGNKRDAKNNLNKIKTVVPDAYIKKVKLYQGCMH